MEWKEIIRAEDVQKLRENWGTQQPLKGTGREKDYQPVVKLYDPLGAAEWYLTEVDEDGLAFGLCYIFEYELGYVDLNEMADLKIEGQPRIQQDLEFEAVKTLSAYADEGRRTGRITVG